MTIPTDDDPPPRTVRMRIGLLVAAYVVVMLAFVGIELTDSELADWISAAIVAVVFSIPAMLTFGAVLLAPWQRLNLVWTIILAISCATTAYELSRPLESLSTILTIPAIAVFLPCLPLRLAGIAIRKLGRTERDQPARPLRFTIAQIMGLTASVAVVTALLRWCWRLSEADELWVDSEVVLVFGFYAVCYVSIAMLALWSVMRIGSPWLRMLIAAGGMVVATVLPSWPLDIEVDWAWMALNLGHGCVTMLALFVVRSCGYRLVRRSKRGPISEPFESVAAAAQPVVTNPHDSAS